MIDVEKNVPLNWGCGQAKINEFMKVVNSHSYSVAAASLRHKVGSHDFRLAAV